RPCDPLHWHGGGDGVGGLRRSEGPPRQDEPGSRCPASGRAQGAPGVLPHAVPHTGLPHLQEGEAYGGDRPQHPHHAHSAGVLCGNIRPERKEARRHEEGTVQTAPGRRGGAGDAEGEAVEGPGGLQGDGGGPGCCRHRVQPPCGREQRGGAHAPQQDGGVPLAPDEAGGGEDCCGARGDQEGSTPAHSWCWCWCWCRCRAAPHRRQHRTRPSRVARLHPRCISTAAGVIAPMPRLFLPLVFTRCNKGLVGATHVTRCGSSVGAVLHCPLPTHSCVWERLPVTYVHASLKCARLRTMHGGTCALVAAHPDTRALTPVHARPPAFFLLPSSFSPLPLSLH
ncbi:hypothetical protein, conserved in T. vivax, (fragment), partial [Trypanosoma vivax Y486]